MGALRKTTSRDERGSALVVVLLVSAAAALLGMGILLLAEAEELHATAWSERTRSRAAAEGAVRLAASWLTTPESAVGLPPPEAWRLDLRRGDRDLDGTLDDSCDGSRPEGRWRGYPAAELTPSFLVADLVREACGESGTPDLVLEGGALDDIERSLGGRVELERIAIHAGPVVGSSRTGLTIEAVAGSRRHGSTTSRVRAIGRVELLPAIPGDDAIVAGGDVRLAKGSIVAWGAVRSGGDVHVPPLGEKGSLRSGMPRRPEGSVAGWATGGATDWNLDTVEREYLLTELIGRSVQGTIIPSDLIVVPELADPWLAIFAAHSIVHDGRRHGGAGVRQPWPYDPRATTVQDDLSFLNTGARAPDVLSEGRVERMAEAVGGTTAGGSALRRFTLAESPRSGEPLWRDNGTGPARTAQAWLDDAAGPVIAAFLADDPPDVVTLLTASGMVLVEARRIVLRPGSEAPLVTANMPGEPWLDMGIDADGDAELDRETVGNGRWDADMDGDGLADAEPGSGWDMNPGPACFVPNRDHDPARLRVNPHEPFLNLAYPADGSPGPVRVAFRAEAVTGAAPVADADGDGMVGSGDLTTTLRRDERGALVRIPAHAHAMIVNMAGDVILEEGYQLLGSVRATGGVLLQGGAAVRLDERLGRDGRLSLPLPQACLGGIAFPTQGLRGGRREAIPDPTLPPSDGAEPPIEQDESPPEMRPPSRDPGVGSDPGRDPGRNPGRGRPGRGPEPGRNDVVTDGRTLGSR